VALDRIIRISTKVETQAKDYPEKMEISENTTTNEIEIEIS